MRSITQLMVMLLACWACGPAVADDAPQNSPEPLPVIPVPQKAEAPPPNSDEPQKEVFQEVVVTATKFKENVRDIAGSVSAIHGEDLERRGYQDAADFVRLVPGVNMTGGGQPSDGTRITMRGVSNISGTTQTSGTFWGDVPFSDPFIARVTLDPNTFDLADVEVLKGPQGTLFGATALNGAVRYVPNAPEIATWKTKVFAQGGTVVEGRKSWDYGGMVNAPIGDDVAVRLLGFNRRDGGYTDETLRGESDVNDFRQYGYRGLATWKPTERWRIDLRHAAQDANAADSSFEQGLDGTLSRHNTPQKSPADTFYRISSLDLKYSFDWGEYSALTSATHKSNDVTSDISRNLSIGGPTDSTALGQYVANNASNGYTHEQRLQYDAPGSPLKAIVGIFGSRVRLGEITETSTSSATIPGLPIQQLADVLPALPGLLRGTVTSNGQASLGVTEFHVTADELALFGQLRCAFGQLEPAISARLFKTSVYGTIRNNGALFTQTNGANPNAVTNARMDERHLNPAASLTWRPARQFMAYGAFGRGFRFGGINSTANDPTVNAPLTYASDIIDNYELGFRSRWFKSTLQVDATVYRLNWKKPQLFQQVQNSTSQYITNVGGAKGEGIEAAILYLPPFLSGVRASVSAAWSRTITTEAFTDVSGNAIAPGTRWPFAPKFQSATTLDYTHSFGDWQARVGVVHSFIGRTYTDLTQTKPVFDYGQLDVSASLAPIVHRAIPEISVTVNNATDRRGWTSLEALHQTDCSIPGAGCTINYAPNYIRPRTITVRLTSEFGR